MNSGNYESNIVGERRTAIKRINMTVEMSVTVDWPEGTPFEEERCLEIAANAAPQSYEDDVGHGETIVWAQVFTESCTDDVTINEIIDLKGNP